MDNSLAEYLRKQNEKRLERLRAFRNLMSTHIDPEETMKKVEELFLTVSCFTNGEGYDPNYYDTTWKPLTMNENHMSSFSEDHYDPIHKTHVKIARLKATITISDKRLYNLGVMIRLLLSLKPNQDRLLFSSDREIVDEYGTLFTCILLPHTCIKKEDHNNPHYYYVSAQQVRDIVVPFLARILAQSPMDMYLLQGLSSRQDSSVPDDTMSNTSDDTVMPNSSLSQLHQKCIVKLYEKLAETGDVTIIDAICKLQSMI
jgi:hypothetical protein